MRAVRIFFALVVLALAIWYYFQSSADSQKASDNLSALLDNPDSAADALTAAAAHSNAVHSGSASYPPPSGAPKPPAVQPLASSPLVGPESVPAAADSSPGAASAWTPPDVLPSHPNWIWETTDGQTYQNVVVTKIEPHTVVISHSLGVAHLLISTLPPDIQKQLSHTPAIASASSTAPAPPSIATAAVATLPSAPDDIKPWVPPDVLPAQANWTWETSDSRTYQNVVVTKIEADTVSITHSLGVAHIPINLLPADIQKQLNYDPHAVPPVPAFLLHLKLVSADGTPVAAPGKSVQYYAIYYSAQWCPPCHAFTPRLVKWYNQFKPAHPNFELIFVSDDHDATSMFNYMDEMAMPWPAVRFEEIKHDDSGIERFAGDGIPDLVLVDFSGKVLSDSYRNGKYVGPSAVIDDINRLIGGDSPVPLARQNLVPTAAKPALISARNFAPARSASAGA